MLVADLHIHSRFSRATARNLTVEVLWAWAQKKGVGLLGTGDFTHPEWVAELEAALEPDGSGFLRLRPELCRGVADQVPAATVGEVRFVLQSEISCIYKAGERTRKVHNLVYFPDFDSVHRFNTQLRRIGNLDSDGRPILGLDSRDLLEIALEANSDALFVPAHIWTPWFSALGSKSGFDTIDECYRDLAGHIHAVETGLSSDPPMNWSVPTLDRFRLLSSSDAHSPSRLAREATCFERLDSWAELLAALKEGTGYRGTLEFYPEEGKYHLDGHRKCQLRLEPEETLDLDGRCPVCGKAVTVGVLHRVRELGGAEPSTRRPETARDYESLVALDEILAEVNGVASRTARRVLRQYEALLSTYGTELHILRELPLEDLRGEDGRLVEALERVRTGQIHVEGGYDGEFGIVKVFPPGQPRSKSLFPVPSPPPEDGAKPRTGRPSDAARARPAREDVVETPLLDAPTAVVLSETQAAVAYAPPGRHVVLAGPGSGKTRVLTERVAHLVGQGADLRRLAVVTFTRKAARELAERLSAVLDAMGVSLAGMEGPFIGTFHGLALTLINRDRQVRNRPPMAVCSEDDLALLRGDGVAECDLAATLQALRLVPVGELVERALKRVEEGSGLSCSFDYLAIDEFQDIDALQFDLVTRLSAEATDVTVIGDPNQSVYGFRGGDPRFFDQFQGTPGTTTWSLSANYRSTDGIQRVCQAVLTGPETSDGAPEVSLVASRSAAAEAEWIAHTIEQLVGGMASHSFNSDRVDSRTDAHYSFDDIAVLTRTGFAADAIEEALVRLGVPVSRPLKPTAEQLRLSLGFDAALRYGLNQADRLAALRLQGWDAGAGGLSFSRVVRTIRHFRGGTMGELADRLFSLLVPEPSLAEEVAYQELRRGSAEPSETVHEWQRHLATLDEPERAGWRQESVHLLTMHAAKGLEFDVVFVAGLEAGLLPYEQGETRSDPAEERRLLYVALSRARRELYLSRARSRRLFGRTVRPEASPFLADLGPLVEGVDNRVRRKARPPRPEPRRLL